MTDLERLRTNLKNSLLSANVSPSDFGRAAGFGTNAGTVIPGFLNGGSIWIRTQGKIEAEMARRGWLRDGDSTSEPVEVEPPAVEAGPQEPSPEAAVPAEPVILPYPEVEDFPAGERDMREIHKWLANYATMALAQSPEHPNKEEILESIEEHKRIADMPNDEFLRHEKYEANPINKLTQDERLHCIRFLPVPIVQKLFPHL